MTRFKPATVDHSFVLLMYMHKYLKSNKYYIRSPNYQYLLIWTGTIMTISKDRVKPSPQPDSWKLSEIFATGVVLGSYLAMMTVIFFWVAYKTDFFPVGQYCTECFYCIVCGHTCFAHPWISWLIFRECFTLKALKRLLRMTFRSLHLLSIFKSAQSARPSSS